MQSSDKTLFISIISGLICILTVTPVYPQHSGEWGGDDMVGNVPIKQMQWKGQQVEYAANQINLKLKEGLTLKEGNEIISQFNARISSDFDELGWGQITIGENQKIAEVIERLSNSGQFVAVEPNLVTTTHDLVEPDDPYYQGNNGASYKHQWNLLNIGQSPPGGSSDADIDGKEGWSISVGGYSTTGNRAVIAVLDSGIPMQDSNNDGNYTKTDLSHPDLDDSDKIILGSDFINDGKGVKDEAGHGTHVSSGIYMIKAKIQTANGKNYSFNQKVTLVK